MISKAIFKELDKLKLIITDQKYREFILLLLKYGRSKNPDQREISFLRYNVEVPDNLSFIFQYKEIFVKEIYRFKSVSDTPVIYDCGSNIGISCIYFKEIYPNARVIAFEADPSIAAVLERNLLRNNLKGIEVIPKAVWINDEGIEFNSDGKDGGSIYGEGKKIKISSVRLKDYLAKEDRIDFLKMDIEGAETEVVLDCSELFFKIQNIFIEYHSWSGQPTSIDKILKVLRDSGFRYYIEPINEIDKPFIDRKISNLNMQVNIFAER
jgi:FkbM family methyltransferase